MKKNPTSPFADLPPAIREELERTPPVTPEMLSRIAESNRKLDTDPEFHSDFLKSVFVEKMLEALEENGETKAQLADHLGKSRQYIQKLFDEDKRVNFTVDTLCAVAQALGRRVHIHVCRAEETPMILTTIQSRRISSEGVWPLTTKQHSEESSIFGFVADIGIHTQEAQNVGANAA